MVLHSLYRDLTTGAFNYLEITAKNKEAIKTFFSAEQWWLTLVILATQEAEVRRIVVRSQPGQIVRETLSKPITKIGHHKNRAGEVAEGPEIKPQYHKKKKKKILLSWAPELRPVILATWGGLRLGGLQLEASPGR
jgi:hypothetical protein